MLPRIVLDTNLIISAVLITDSVSRRTFDKVIDEGVILLSVPLLFELLEVFHRNKFDKYLTENERMRFLVGFLKVTELIEIIEEVNICRDERDNKLLELAINGKADFLVTGDEDLLVLHSFNDVKILSPQVF